jgi:hypothetical protein
MSGITLRTYILIKDLLPMSEALSFTEKEALVLLKYKEVREGHSHILEKEIKQSPIHSRNWVVWKCPVQLEDNKLKPAGRTPKEGCGQYNIMSTKHGEHKLKNGIFQSSPCEKCGKRTRQNGLFKFFSSQIQALKYAQNKNKELEV